jgi:hypothetical protein
MHDACSLIDTACSMHAVSMRPHACVRGQMPRIATTGINSWQTALKWTVDCQVPPGQVKPVALRSQIHTSVCGNPRDGYSIFGNPRSKRHGLPQSAAHI